MAEWDPPLPPDVLSRLRELVGLLDPDPTVELHRNLARAVYRTRNKSHGDQLIAVRLVFNWAQLDAGKRKAVAKAAYDKLVDQGTTKLLMEAAAGSKRLSRKEAEQRVQASDEAYTLKLESLVVEHEEQSYRKFLETLSGGTSTWQTHRADDRAADVDHANGIGSHA
jgi:hypothetical protein